VRSMRWAYGFGLQVRSLPGCPDIVANDRKLQRLGWRVRTIWESNCGGCRLLRCTAPWLADPFAATLTPSEVIESGLASV
jgi:G:T-mismatch repair DNA endonuclease (very short patch repair protein)